MTPAIEWVRFGGHLPLIDFDGWQRSSLVSDVDTARGLGYRYLCPNDHSTYQRPWLDGIVALSSVVHGSGDMDLVLRCCASGDRPGLSSQP
jgi:hypothetical protein